VSLALIAVGQVPTRALLYLVVALFGLFVGAVDATMNMQGVGVQRWYGRSLLGSFHAVWSVAGILGALATAGSNRLDLSLGTSLIITGGIGLAVSLIAGPGMMTKAEERAAVSESRPADTSVKIPWKPITLVGLAVMIMFVADSATSTWGTLYLRDALDSAKSVAPLGLAAYLACQLLGRTLTDHTVDRFGPARTVAAGGIVGALGLGLVVAAPVAIVAIAGFGLTGLGLSVIVPQAFSAAGALDPTGNGEAIARVNLFNYAGFVAGNGITGAVGSASSLRWGYAIPAVLSLCIVALAPTFAKVIRGTGSGAL
jgi:Na+/melibiose symporter-like transporter